MRVSVCICMCMCMYVCVGVCVCVHYKSCRSNSKNEVMENDYNNANETKRNSDGEREKEEHSQEYKT